MTTRIAIDPNVRVADNHTYAGFEDIETGGPVEVGMRVYVVELESNLVGHATVVDIDTANQLIYLDVDWSSLTEPSADALEIRANVGRVAIHHLTTVSPGSEVLSVGSPAEISPERAR